MPLHENDFAWLIEAGLREDIGHGDLTGELLIPPMQTARLTMTARQPLVVAGIGIAATAFLMADDSLQCNIILADGDRADAGMGLMEVEGSARSILAAERTALNFLGRLCGVASLTYRYVEAVAGTKAQILDTRKTLPGWRALDKYAVRTGGGTNHRMRLDDGVLVKDNHIALLGSVRAAVEIARAGTPALTRIEIECDTLAQAEEALAAGADMLLLDNMSLDELRQAVAMNQGRARLEASGNVTLETVRAIAETGVDFISVGRLTHSAPNADIGLDVEMVVEAD